MSHDNLRINTMFRTPGLTKTGSLVVELIKRLPVFLQSFEQQSSKQQSSKEHSELNNNSFVERIKKRPGLSSTNDPQIRRIFRDNWQKAVKIPTIIDDYNHNMNGIDLANQYRAFYETHMPTNRTWLVILYWIIDHAIVNAYILHLDWLLLALALLLYLMCSSVNSSIFNSFNTQILYPLLDQI
ncbi:predicted protein [Histoplasma mississippiense (nom. inval.)]|uniref:predicted protein n=1 Tax=Ajellomyces capsulatus (strain NAm1 / WU24) TaxID=2059318 RepID=UPI000157B3CA|nr:predicted protein [Histoplasma mississippiense (nom. inval.)]EDN03213.1 predicted protein [Histoplasma mississippiense (nom. inval.)]